MKALLVIGMFLLMGCVPQGQSGSQDRAAANANDNADDSAPQVNLAERYGLGEDPVTFSCEKNRESDGMHLEFSLQYEKIYDAILDEEVAEIITTCAAYYSSLYVGAGQTRREGEPGYSECHVMDMGNRNWSFTLGENGVTATSDRGEVELFAEGECE